MLNTKEQQSKETNLLVGRPAAAISLTSKSDLLQNIPTLKPKLKHQKAAIFIKLQRRKPHLFFSSLCFTSNADPKAPFPICSSTSYFSISPPLIQSQQNAAKNSQQNKATRSQTRHKGLIFGTNHNIKLQIQCKTRNTLEMAEEMEPKTTKEQSLSWRWVRVSEKKRQWRWKLKRKRWLLISKFQKAKGEQENYFKEKQREEDIGGNSVSKSGTICLLFVNY